MEGNKSANNQKIKKKKTKKIVMKRKWTSNYGPDGQTFTHHYSVYIENVFTNNQKTNQPRTKTKHSYKLQLLVNESHKFYKTDYYYNTFDINQSKPTYTFIHHTYTKT